MLNFLKVPIELKVILVFLLEPLKLFIEKMLISGVICA